MLYLTPGKIKVMIVHVKKFGQSNLVDIQNIVIEELLQGIMMTYMPEV